MFICILLHLNKNMKWKTAVDMLLILQLLSENTTWVRVLNDFHVDLNKDNNILVFPVIVLTGGIFQRASW